MRVKRDGREGKMSERDRNGGRSIKRPGVRREEVKPWRELKQI